MGLTCAEAARHTSAPTVGALGPILRVTSAPTVGALGPILQVTTDPFDSVYDLKKILEVQSATRSHQHIRLVCSILVLLLLPVHMG